MPLAQPKEKIERRLGERLFLKGERSFSQKSATQRRPYPPGMHGKKRTRRGAQSEYSKQLREKQKIRRAYGLTDRMLKQYFNRALRVSGKPTDRVLGELLERRIDNVVFRLGFAISRSIARHMVSYGHIVINGKRIRQPSILTKIGDIVSISKSSLNSGIFRGLDERMKKIAPPPWLELDRENIEGKILGFPEMEDTAGKQQLTLVVEYYSK